MRNSAIPNKKYGIWNGKPTFYAQYRGHVMLGVATNTWLTTKEIAKISGLPINAVRRVLDFEVKQGILARRQASFWNGMFWHHYNSYIWK